MHHQNAQHNVDKFFTFGHCSGNYAYFQNVVDYPYSNIQLLFFFQWNTSTTVTGDWSRDNGGPSLVDDSRINDHVNRTLHLRSSQKSSQVHKIKPCGSPAATLPFFLLTILFIIFGSSARPLIESLGEFERGILLLFLIFKRPVSFFKVFSLSPVFFFL